MTDLRRLSALTQVTAVALQAAQTEMAQLNREEMALRDTLAQLVADRAAQTDQALADGAATPLAGTDIRWHAWVDGRRATLNAELANVLARKEACQSRLRLAFGRDQAAQALAKKVTLQAQIIAIRRAAYES